MLLNNYSIINRNQTHDIAIAFSNPYNHYKLGIFQNYYCGQSSVTSETDKSSIFNGTYPPYSLVLAPKGGALSATTLVTGANGFTTVNLAGGLLADASLSQTSDVTSNIIGNGIIASTLTQLNSIIADISGQLQISASISQTSSLSADLGAMVDILASLSQISTLVGDLQGALAINASISQTSSLSADISGQLNAAATLPQTSSITADIIGGWFMDAVLAQTSTLTANIEALGELVSNIIGDSELTGDFSGSTGNLSATFTNVSTLSPENLAAAVWNSLAADFNTALTMGNKLNSAGSAGDPWSTELPGIYANGTAGKIIGDYLDRAISSGSTQVSLDAVQILIDELHKLQGLDQNNPMTVTPTSRTVGDITLNITGDGETSTTVTRE